MEIKVEHRCTFPKPTQAWINGGSYGDDTYGYNVGDTFSCICGLKFTAQLFNGRMTWIGKKMRAYKTAKSVWGFGFGRSNGNWHVQLFKWVFTTEPA